MKMYKASTLLNTIEKVDISEHESLHDTFEEARDFLIRQHNKDMREYERYMKQEIDCINKLKLMEEK